jgi:murein L,D-transpeptidase YcbB/YkuD
VLQRMGLRVETSRDGSVAISQPPGPGNALGRSKFNFPNKFDVYLHDTPDKYLFAKDVRAFSHGCMRVQNPDQFGEQIASIGLPGEGFTAEKLTSMYGKSETMMPLKGKIPVHLTYQTAYVSDKGDLVIRDDIYGLDRRVIAAMKGEDRDYGEEEVAAKITHTPAPKRSARANPPPTTFGGFLENIFRN